MSYSKILTLKMFNKNKHLQELHEMDSLLITEFSQYSYENINDSYSDTSFERQRSSFEPQAKSNDDKGYGGWPRKEI
ncbi:hypothetical protein C1645_760496 [Glomus cerebriforme]|uniref:Uncharacterized protein n=1 Tax=Glomus cerebriforme TaxID=658196 RepID=A0A397TBA2_9GLOM|nr:hypothetical protein C1645_760496 [Glomus cerebriforme]